jgi:hypothetical protein
VSPSLLLRFILKIFFYLNVNNHAYIEKILFFLFLFFSATRKKNLRFLNIFTYNKKIPLKHLSHQLNVIFCVLRAEQKEKKREVDIYLSV